MVVKAYSGHFKPTEVVAVAVASDIPQENLEDRVAVAVAQLVTNHLSVEILEHMVSEIQVVAKMDKLVQAVVAQVAEDLLLKETKVVQAETAEHILSLVHLFTMLAVAVAVVTNLLAV